MKEKHEKNTVEAARIPPAPVAEAKAGDQAAFTEPQTDQRHDLPHDPLHDRRQRTQKRRSRAGFHSCTEIAAIGTACPIAASFLLERG